MKPSLRSFITFSRTERLGIVALLSLLVILIAVRATMQYWAPAPIEPAQQQKLISILHDSTLTPHSLPLPVNLNTADSATLLTLPGIGPALAHHIIHHRPFTSYRQLLAIPRFPHHLVDSLPLHTTLK